MNFFNQYWMQFLYWVFLALVTYLTKRLSDYRKILFSTQSGIKSLLRSNIIELYNKYKLSNCITLAEKENIENLYKEYKENGGNGFIDNLIEEIRDMETSSNCDGGE